jgi:misacylated tRNA(Ala) deacylase
VRLNKSLFYPTSGGQPGDTGILSAANQNFDIMATLKDKEHDDVIHLLPEGCSLPQVGDKVSGKIDWDTRYKHMRMHTAMHLLCSLIEGDATGGQIGAEKSRLDFNVPGDAYDKEALTTELNALIKADHPVSTSWITDEELQANPQLIRTMSVKPPMGSGKVRTVRIGTEDNMVDYQPCGGTHVKSTAEIGKIRVSKIENKGKQNRRFHIIFDEEG